MAAIHYQLIHFQYPVIIQPVLILTRQLERQIHSNLWERLLMSNDRESHNIFNFKTDYIVSASSRYVL